MLRCSPPRSPAFRDVGRAESRAGMGKISGSLIYSGLMGFYSGLMGFYSDSMGC